ncbi:MAG TPA: N-acetylmuramoyl-L-alanine amidase [Pyrinomonadaceae bacterium]|jgi:N-acetylmuramoyl-L-alanine amidase
MSKTILISAGHTNVKGQDRGAASGVFVEGVEATRLRDATASYLKELNPNLKVIEDGFDGVNDPLQKAVALARTASVAIEFHFNAGPAKATGIEVLSKLKNKDLAQKIAGAIHSATGLALRGERGWKSDSSGQHHRLAFCEAGGLIVEVAFISNPDDMQSYRINFERLARGVAAVLARS